MGYNFDGPNKLVVLTAGTTSVDLADLWSRWKDWVATGANAGYARALDTVGGEDIDATAGTKVPLYLFLLNGWRVRPQEASHTLTVAGGTLIVAGGGDPFVDTLGNYRVRVRFSQPLQAIGYSTTGGGGASPDDVAAAVVARAVEGGLSLEAVLRIVLAAVAGKSAGAGTLTETFYGRDGTTPRVTTTFDESGNRQAVVVNGT